MNEFEEIIVRWSVRLSVFCYLAFCLSNSPSDSTDQTTQSKRLFRIWTLGLIFFLIHFVTSMGFAHQWSHQTAYESTASQTEAVTGWNWGGGIYFNYFFSLVWIADVAMWWKNGLRWLNYRRYQTGLHCFFAFIIINATVVFGPRFWWMVAAIFCVAFVWKKVRQKTPDEVISS